MSTLEHSKASRSPYVLCLIIGLGGLFAGITGPLLSNFIPPLVRDAVGDRRTLIGVVMAIDNVLLLLLVPWTGALSDLASARGRSRLPLVLCGFGLASIGMVVVGVASSAGLVALIGALVVLHTGINMQRSPFHALLVDEVPSRYRSLANGSVVFQMCLGAIVFLMLGMMLGMRTAFLIGAVSILAVMAVVFVGLRHPARAEHQTGETTFATLLDAVRSAATGALPGFRQIFVATLFLQLTFQSFTTWYALHAMERFGVRVEDATIGFIAWAVGGVIGAIPAGFVGMRIGRRNAMLLGLAVMAVSLVALDRVNTLTLATPLIALTSASWAFPSVNAYPLFVEPVPPNRRGTLAAVFILCMALAGAIGDPLNGRLFDAFAGYRPLFLMMAIYTAVSFTAVMMVRPGSGEAV